jgi:hypothetical protein
VAEAAAATENPQVVIHQIAAATGENGQPID